MTASRMKCYQVLTSLFWGGLVMAVGMSCDGPGPGPDSTDFDQEAMLQFVGKEIILPTYAELANNTSALRAAVEALTTTPTEENLSTAQTALFLAWETWQAASPYELGPAENEILRSNVNIYPTDVQQIENNILTGGYDLNAASNLDAKGFPALDYLLHAQESSATLEALADTDRAAYLVAISTDLDSRVQAVHTAWSPAGANYVSTFANSLGTDAGSSLSLLVNQFNFDFELLKNGQLGIPLGKRTLGEAQPERTEAYYSGRSTELAVAHMEAIHKLYRGVAFGSSTNGLSLEDYLETLNPVFDGETALADAISTQLSETEAALLALPSPLSEAVVNQASLVDNAWNEVQAQVVLFKTDMPSALGVLITYQDNDGD